MKMYYLFVCCDESSPGVYGKIVSVVREIEDGREMKSVALHDVTFAKLLRMIPRGTPLRSGQADALRPRSAADQRGAALHDQRGAALPDLRSLTTCRPSSRSAKPTSRS